ncbi:putative bifunctional diguanylate cyclase/phosphodiesterase [Thermomonas sp.]|uniref:putative bifunctional diguanylate cyclase/phosphodiesterase n=1 Tax=Thermomonas sp. TaxID=1971895 RepID=UPI0035B1B64E
MARHHSSGNRALGGSMLLAPLPALAADLGTPGDHWLVLLLALLVLLLAWLAIASHQRRVRDQQAHLKALREHDQRLRLSLWASNELYWQYDLRRRELERTQVSPDKTNDLVAHFGLDHGPQIHPEDLPRTLAQLRAYLHGKSPIFRSEHRMRGDDGQWQWVRVRGRAVGHDANGRVTRIAGTARNIDALRELESQRQIAGEVLRNMAESVVVLDADFHFVAVNPAFSQMSGYDGDEVIGRDAALLNGSRHPAEFHQQARQQILARSSWTGEMWQRRKDGREFLCAMQCNAIEDPGTQQRLYVLVTSDITERRRIEQELRYLANFDPLTNLPNRTLLAERLSHAIVQARRHGRRLALLFLDLDNFKDINDSLGHATGDRVLRATAQRLQDVAGTACTVARISGDEFAILLENLGDPAEADALARAILDAFDAPLALDDRRDFTISPSIGISLFPEHALVPTDLLKHADTAMYRAKGTGKHAFMRYAPEMEGDIRRRAGMVAGLRRAVERGELRLVFQPQLALADNRFAAVEALLRWDSPEFGEVPPQQFIPLAEDSGSIVAIGHWVLAQACRTLASWRSAGLDPRLAMSVNVSAVQLLRGELSHSVAGILADTALPSTALELELTESVLMANAALASERLQAFRDHGVSIAVDDFGTGYSSLAYLHRLPITTLKIDKAFIDGLATPGDQEDTTITTTVIAMARTLGLRTVAEGVETAAQLDFLRRHACDIAQGYWIARPMGADACLRFLLDAQDRAGPAPLQLDHGALPA